MMATVAIGVTIGLSYARGRIRRSGLDVLVHALVVMVLRLLVMLLLCAVMVTNAGSIWIGWPSRISTLFHTVVDALFRLWIFLVVRRSIVVLYLHMLRIIRICRFLRTSMTRKHKTNDQQLTTREEVY
jgi:TRAP-type C4-dicarboxylate transport system permease small subunit